MRRYAASTVSERNAADQTMYIDFRRSRKWPLSTASRASALLKKLNAIRIERIYELQTFLADRVDGIAGLCYLHARRRTSMDPVSPPLLPLLEGGRVSG
jgi:hypothetical protein